MQGDTAIHCVLLLPRDLDLDLGRRRLDLDLDLALPLSLSREKDLGRLGLCGDLFLSPRLHDLLEELELDLVADLVLSEADLEMLLEREPSLRFSDASLAVLVMSSPFGFRLTFPGLCIGVGSWVFFSSWSDLAAGALSPSWLRIFLSFCFAFSIISFALLSFSPLICFSCLSLTQDLIISLTLSRIEICFTFFGLSEALSEEDRSLCLSASYL